MGGVKNISRNKCNRVRCGVSLKELVAKVKEALAEVACDDVLYGVPVRDGLAGVVAN